MKKWTFVGVGFLSILVACGPPEMKQQRQEAVAGTAAESAGTAIALAKEAEATRMAAAGSTRSAIAVATREAEATRMAQAEEHIEAAGAYRERGELGLALEELRQAVALAPAIPQARQMRDEISADATATVVEARAQATAEAEREASARATARAQATAAAEAAKPRVVATGAPTFSSRARVGGPGSISIRLRNDGGSPARSVRFQISSSFFDGFLLLQSSPPFRGDRNFLGDRYLDFPGLGPGEEREYRLALVGKAAGEYSFSLTVYFDDRGDVGHFSGRSVVLP